MSIEDLNPLVSMPSSIICTIGRIDEVSCWADGRRPFTTSTGRTVAPIAGVALERIREPYDIGAERGYGNRWECARQTAYAEAGGHIPF